MPQIKNQTSQSEHVRRAIQMFGSQTALADRIELSQQYVSALICGRLQCSAEAAIKIEDATAGHVSAQQLRPDLFARSAKPAEVAA